MAESNMERVSLRIPKANLEAIEQMVEDGVFPNRSEALRSGVVSVINEHAARPPIEADGSGILDSKEEQSRRERTREKYGTLNPSGALLASDEALRSELPAVLANSQADGARIMKANGTQNTAAIELTYHVDGRLGSRVFGLERDSGDVHPDDVRIVQLGQTYVALEPGATVRDLYARSMGLTSGGYPETLEDALSTIAVIRESDFNELEMPHPDDYVPYNLECIGDEAVLCTHLVPASEQPVYPEGLEDSGVTES